MNYQKFLIKKEKLMNKRLDFQVKIKIHIFHGNNH